MNTRLGLEVFLDDPAQFVGQSKRVGLVASAASLDHELIHSAERLFRHPAVNLKALFGPEHGLRGAVQAGEKVKTGLDPVYGLPVYSLYGETYRPTADMLRDLDVLIIDLPDGGVRFYTYLSTLAHVMQSAAEQKIPVIVLDRPAPLNGNAVEGPILGMDYTSFVGIYPIPIRYGMTFGEIAGLFNTAFQIGCDLTVVRMQHWRREWWFDQTGLPFIPPSPNLPTLSALTAYPGTCLIEGTNLSEGRGTTMPFQYFGAPWLNAESLTRRLNDLAFPGVRFRPVYFTPSFSKYQGQPCEGIHLFVTDREAFRPIEVVLHVIALVQAEYPEQFAWREPWASSSHIPIDLLSGGKQVREHLNANQPVSELISQWKPDLEAFCKLRANCLLYPA
jgi:uncharacterized protein YbbC (DUF1343 family)